MKRRFFIIFLTLAVLFSFTACGAAEKEDENQDPLFQNPIVQKLCQIESDWTEEQVHALLGLPDEKSELTVIENYYVISKTEKELVRGCVRYYHEGIMVELFKTTTILDALDKGETDEEPTTQNPLLQKMYQVESNWTKEQVYALLGQPDLIPSDGSIDEYYNVSDTEIAQVRYTDEGITIKNVETTVILDVPD